MLLNSDPVTVSVVCQLDKVWQYLGDKPGGTPVRDCLNYGNQCSLAQLGEQEHSWLGSPTV